MLDTVAVSAEAVSDDRISVRTRLAEADDIDAKEDEMPVTFNPFVVTEEAASVAVLIVCAIIELSIAVDVYRLVVDKRPVNRFVKFIVEAARIFVESSPVDMLLIEPLVAVICAVDIVLASNVTARDRPITCVEPDDKYVVDKDAVST